MKKGPSKRPSTQAQKMARAKATFKRKIRSIFTGAGFTYLPTGGHEMFVGRRKVEVDALFIYENVWLLCEDTLKTTNVRDHIRTKHEAFNEIRGDLPTFIRALAELFPEQQALFDRYMPDRICLFCLYIPSTELDLTEDDRALFSGLTFVQPRTLNYFNWIVQAIKRSARNEIFRFLGLKSSDIGLSRSSCLTNQISAPIIYPQEFTGTRNNVRVVSFMMSAQDLLDTCYVLRKDNWEESMWLYQRLIEKKKLQNIRESLIERGETFYNNIIVALPDSVTFRDADGQYKDITKIDALTGNCQMILPREMNSLCVIDGQHRIFAHYESGTDSPQEQRIAALRKQLHLLVTGLVFPPEMSAGERARIQSDIFLGINMNAKLVPQNVILQIKRILAPTEGESLAQYVLEKLDREGIFYRLFQLSSLDDAPIKTASIVQYGLKPLVTASPTRERPSLFDHWDGDKAAFQALDSTAIDAYVQFCASTLRCYFSAIKRHLARYWDDRNAKLLSVISINGFITAFTRQLPVNGVRDFSFYDEKFRNWDFDFSREGFPYTSSQYKKFSTRILEEVFGFSPEEASAL